MPGTLLDHFLARAERHPEREAFRDAFGKESWSWGAWHDAARQLAESLVAAGVELGSRIAIFAGNSPVWPIADVGTLLAGAVSVGIYPTSTRRQVAELMADSGARWLITDTAAGAGLLAPEDRAALPSLDRVVAWDEGASLPDVESWGSFIRRRPEHATALAARSAAVGPETLAMLLYTSGSTGVPKGAMLTHRYLLTSVESIHNVIDWRENDLVLAYLPFNHAAERITGLWSRVRYGHRAVLVDDHRRLFEAARAHHPTVFGSLPRAFEKLHAAMHGAEDPAAVLRAHLGDRVRLATSGGASLPAEVARDLAGAGLELLGAYGLTEHLCVAFNRPGRARADTAGPPMAGTRIKIAEDGEILVERGALTFSGYWQQPEATREAFTADGVWLRTGDLGVLEPDGSLRVTGRKKDLLALSTGKKVAPAPIEARLRQSPLISLALVVGEGRKHLAALLFVAPDVATREADGLAEELERAVALANRDAAPSEQVRRWVMVPVEPDQSRGELTLTYKVRREILAERYGRYVEECYA